jgi:DNA-directed RNA polymerase subunit RPC12/RpoP
MHIILDIPITKKMNPGAFRGDMACPYCGCGLRGKPRARWKYIEKTSPFRIRYQCKDCGRTMQYDFSNNADWVNKHPYEPYKKSKFRKIVESWKNSKVSTG